MKPKRAILYARFSPRPNAAECQSVEAQLTEGRTYCAGKDYVIVGEYFDKALSGGSDDRPGLEDALAALRRGYVLVATNMDRIARGNGLTEAILLKVAGKGALVETCDGVATSLETKDMRLLRGIKQVLAEYARDSTRELTSKRMRQYQSNGRRMSRILQYGWRDAGHRTVVDPLTSTEYKQRLTEPDPDELRIIEIIKGLSASGLSLQKIGTQLEVQGILCRGREWVPSTIMRILRRESAAATAAI